jgi:hypothetical protein
MGNMQKERADEIRGTNKTDPPLKKVLSYPSFETAFDVSNWVGGGNPYNGLTRIAQKEAYPWVSIGLLGMSSSSLSFSLSRSFLLLFSFFLTCRPLPGCYWCIATHLNE